MEMNNGCICCTGYREVSLLHLSASLILLGHQDVHVSETQEQ